MDGLRFILIICLFAQVAQAQNAASGTERDFGWQVADDGALEYIVQLAPDKIALMQSTHQENISDMPPELVGRVTRFVVRIGTEPLPRTPSLDNIASYFPKLNSVADLSNALDQIAFLILNLAPILNVQNGGTTPSPNLPSPLPNLPKYNLDQNLPAAEAPLANLPNPNLARDFLSAAGNNATQPSTAPRESIAKHQVPRYSSAT
ncbi:MAG: hypothetical protein R3C53_18665 [Pirellulaceae bacterium]